MNDLPILNVGKVSIIVPAYNAEKTIRKTIESIIKQTYENIEIILVNDGSTDRTSKIIDEYKNKIKIFTKNNGGIVDACNVGLKASSGSWIKFIGSDDMLMPHSIEYFCKTIAKTPNREKSIYVCDEIRIDEYDKELSDGRKKYSRVSSSDPIVDRIFNKSYGNVITMYPKSAFDKHGLFDINFLYGGEDTEFTLRLIVTNGYEIVYVNQPLVLIRMHQSFTKKNLKYSYIVHRNIVNKVLDDMNENDRKKYKKLIKSHIRRLRKNKSLLKRILCEIKELLYNDVLPDNMIIVIEGFRTRNNKKLSFE